MVKTSPENIREIIRLYIEEKESSHKIGKILDIPQSTVYDILKKETLLRKNNDVSYRKTTFDYDYFKNVDSEDKAYWLGFLYADGGMTKDGYTIALCLKYDDLNHLEQFKKDIKFSGNIREDNKGKYDRAVIEISSKELCNDLIKVGVFPQKTFFIKFPTLEQVPENLQHHFIRGYFDGDGYIEKNAYQIEIIGTEEFLFELSNVVYKNIGINPSQLNNKNKFSKNIVSLRYNKKQTVLQICEYLYKDAKTFLKRKKDRYDIAINKN